MGFFGSFANVEEQMEGAAFVPLRLKCLRGMPVRRWAACSTVTVYRYPRKSTSLYLRSLTAKLIFLIRRVHRDGNKKNWES